MTSSILSGLQDVRGLIILEKTVGEITAALAMLARAFPKDRELTNVLLVLHREMNRPKLLSDQDKLSAKSKTLVIAAIEKLIDRFEEALS